MKYEIIKEDFIEVGLFKTKVYRIKSTSTNELGGYIEKESNLSHEGGCWVGGEAAVYGNARVLDNAMVCDSAVVRGDAIVRGKAAIGREATIFGNAQVLDNATIGGVAQIKGFAKVREYSKVFGWPEIEGQTDVHGESIISDWAKIMDSDLEDCQIGGSAMLRGVSAKGLQVQGSGSMQGTSV